MALSFQQKLTLENGAVILYHEGTLQNGKDFHVLIIVPGANLEEYFNFIATQEDFRVKELGIYGEIISCDVGRINEAEMEERLKKWK